MRRGLILALLTLSGLAVLAGVAPAQPVDAPTQGGVSAPPAGTPPQRQQAAAILKAVQELIAASRFEDAERKLQEARDLDPTYPAVYSNFGYLYDAWREHIKDVATTDQIIALRTKALDAYGQLLTLWPDDAYGREHIKPLFYEGYFPRAVREPYLAFSSVGFVNDVVRVGDLTRRLAYTNSVLFHEDMKRGGAQRDGEPPQIAVPVTGDKVFCQVNRSCYGYTMAADSDRYLLSFVLSWPSETLSAGRNYSPVATRLVHLLLRYCWYGRLYLNLPRESGLVSAYMCPQGPAGAETYKDALYFYHIDTPRSGIEWARQAAHEYGHLVLPEIGRFARPEPFASGELGERLFLQCLAQEAGEVSGDPWPSEAARQAVAALWPDGDFAVADYIEKVCRTSLDYWLTAGPDAGLLSTGEIGADAMQYLIGFLLWTQAAYGPDMLRGVLQSAAGTQPSDYIVAFKSLVARQAQQGALSMDAGSLNLKASKLKQPPLEGALRRREVVVSPSDSLLFYAYLPAGTWTLAPQPSQPELTVMLDGKGPLPLDEKGCLPLGRLATDGWHTIGLRLSDKGQAFTLERLTLRLEPQT